MFVWFQKFLMLKTQKLVWMFEASTVSGWDESVWKSGKHNTSATNGSMQNLALKIYIIFYWSLLLPCPKKPGFKYRLTEMNWNSHHAIDHISTRMLNSFDTSSTRSCGSQFISHVFFPTLFLISILLAAPISLHLSLLPSPPPTNLCCSINLKHYLLFNPVILCLSPQFGPKAASIFLISSTLSS